MSDESDDWIAKASINNPDNFKNDEERKEMEDFAQGCIEHLEELFPEPMNKNPETVMMNIEKLIAAVVLLRVSEDSDAQIALKYIEEALPD